MISYQSTQLLFPTFINTRNFVNNVIIYGQSPVVMASRCRYGQSVAMTTGGRHTTCRCIEAVIL